MARDETTAPTDTPPSRPTCEPEASERDEAKGRPGHGGEDAEQREHPPLSTPVRVLLYFAGWILLLVGLLGLALPGIQGVLTLVLGASVLSLVSEAAHRWIRALFHPWPKGGEHFERFRKRLRERLARFHRHRD